MFANALKSISSTNISSNYTISPNLTSTAGPWKIYPAKNKKTGKECSVFVFDKKSLDAHRNGMTRAEVADFKKALEAVIERLKKEASAIAKLRHPGVLEVVEPVEETRGGGLQFVAEAVTASLSGLLQEKDDQERGGAGGRTSRYVTEDADGNRRRRELEIDELEIQKGLLQVSKALEFLHDNAGLSDWKLSGLSFCGPLENSTTQSSMQPINLREVLRHTPSLPRTVQLNLDYTSPDFVIDNNLTASADMFSLGLLIISLYNSPHKSPISCNSSLSAYQRIFQSSQSIPNSTNNFLSSRALPKELTTHVLPRLITRRPAQRMTASEFQQSEFFNNILVSTIRFLDAFPAKTPNEKLQFLRGLMKVLPSFPKSVMEKKLLPALLDELKDKELISLILHNVFKIIELLPSGRRAFTEKVRPSLKEILANAKQTQEKDAARDAGLMVVIEQLPVIGDNCGGKEFKDDVLPIIFNALESSTPSLVDAALRSLPSVLPQLDFSTIKNELFPGLASFRHALWRLQRPQWQRWVEWFRPAEEGDLVYRARQVPPLQEKIVPLIKVIKTREPAVMIAALNVLQVVGKVADAEFVAVEILPILWSMSLGPLLDLKQFQSFMELINRNSTPAPAFSWSTAPAALAAAPANKIGAVKAQQPGFRTVTPDLASFQPITPTTTQFSQPLQPAQKAAGVASAPLTPQAPSINWGAAAAPSSNNLWSSPPTTQQPPTSTFGSLSLGQQQQQPTQNRAPTFSLPPPPSTNTNTSTATSSFSGFSLAPPPGASQTQPPRPPITTTTSTPAFGGLGSMNSTSSMNSPASMGATANKMGSANPGMGMGMGMGMAAMKNMSAGTGAGTSMGMGMGNGMSMNSMTGMGTGMGMGMGLAQQQQSQWQSQSQGQGQGQGQGQKSGLDKYESLL
ncbi:hypothetical protein CHGG_08993 [Chaetomium globosum CBS 148.51]|uniref:Protein kinase domain-containing protein n=1 Tax=Chaetomium globosum (strain ATCC 6205 / CBS 148.51 / DSM 1962 / NBRC 6347 / NRRL 1970) TaxID=306901 RepID=Q2GSR1_CHAGB|nr:uncharacterized protein CHGG_08993 [Chaetomium globosum CBS 148.51]EAQ84979.1 hypothetical protein CHGG_08993 [Chaetomium globosum CBS 148.51]